MATRPAIAIRRVVLTTLPILVMIAATIISAIIAPQPQAHAATKFTALDDLNGRARPSSSAQLVRTYQQGQTINVTCQTRGEMVYGSNIWNKTTEGVWVTDFYVKTGYTGFVPGLARCDDDTTDVCAAGHGRNNGPVGPTTGTSAEKIERIIDLAIQQTKRKLSYSWGGGGKGGPGCGIASLSPGGYNDYYRYGFDCSGLTQYLFWAGAGIDIGPHTNSQSFKGTKVAYSKRQVGDLLFWGPPGNTTHVALYIGNGKIIEAAPPRGTSSVHITNVYGSHSYAIRIFN